MGLGGAEMDKSVAEDIRVELEENRQYLVRALRAVETTTAECKEEARLATTKAENALALVRSLEAAALQRDEAIAMIEQAGAQRIEDLAEQIQRQSDQLQEQHEQAVEVKEAFEAQVLTIRDLREQVYSLQLRVLKNDEESDRAGCILNRAADDRLTALSGRVTKYESEANQLKWQVQNVHEEMHAAVQQKIAEIAGSVQQQDSHLETALRAAEVKVQAQISNSEALSALSLDEMEARLKSQMTELADALSQKQGFEHTCQSQVNALQAELTELQNKWHASVQESKSEVEAMFKGEMLLTQRMNLLEGTLKGETSSNMAELEAALVQVTSTLDVLSEWVQVKGANREDLQAQHGEISQHFDEFRAKLDLVAEEIDKQSMFQNSASQRLEEVSNQQAVLGKTVQQVTGAQSQSSSPEFEKQMAMMVPKMEALEGLVQSIEALITSTPTPTPRGRDDSPRLAALHSIHTMQIALEEHAAQIQALQKQAVNKSADTVQGLPPPHDDVESLKHQIQMLDEQFGLFKSTTAKAQTTNLPPPVPHDDMESLRHQIQMLDEQVELLKSTTAKAQTANLPPPVPHNSVESLRNQIQMLDEQVELLKSTTAEAQTANLPPPVAIEIVLDMEMSRVGDKDKFKQEVAKDIARAADISEECVKVQNVRAGSVIVDMVLYPDAQSRDLLSSLKKQVGKSDSVLMQGKHTKKTKSLDKILEPTSHELSTEIAALRAKIQIDVDELGENQEDYRLEAVRKHDELVQKYVTLEQQLRQGNNNSPAAAQSIAGKGSTKASGNKEAAVTSHSDTAGLTHLLSSHDELKQEHMNLYGRVVAMERAHKTSDAKGPPLKKIEDSAGALDHWALEGRVSRVLNCFQKCTDAKAHVGCSIFFVWRRQW